MLAGTELLGIGQATGKTHESLPATQGCSLDRWPVWKNPELMSVPTWEKPKWFGKNP